MVPAREITRADFVLLSATNGLLLHERPLEPIVPVAPIWPCMALNIAWTYLALRQQSMLHLLNCHIWSQKLLTGLEQSEN
jgi:hypothetical protein